MYDKMIEAGWYPMWASDGAQAIPALWLYEKPNGKIISMTAEEVQSYWNLGQTPPPF